MNNVFNDLFWPITKEPAKKIKKITYRSGNKNKSWISKYVCSQNIKALDKLPNELRGQFKDNVHSKLVDYDDSYCGLYATE